MARREGEVSTGQAARILEVHIRTVREWARRALAGEDSILAIVRLDITGRYWLSRSEVLDLRDRAERVRTDRTDRAHRP